MNTLFTWFLIMSFIGLVVGLIKPTVFAFALKQNANRKKTSLIFGVLLILFFILVAANGSTDIAKKIADFDSPEAVTVNIAETDDLNQLKAGLLVQATLANVATSFVDARISTDVLLQTDFNKKSFEEWDVEYTELMKKWAKADEAIKVYNEALSAIDDDTTSLISSPKLTFVDNFIKTTYAELTRGEVLAIYDAAPPNEKLKTVAKVLGVDARMAQDILADIRQGMNIHYGNIAKANDVVAKGLEAVMTGSKVVVFVGGIGATGAVMAVAGMSVKAALAAGMTAFSGADVVFEVTKTGVSIGMADGDRKNKITAYLKSKQDGPLGYVNATIAIYDLNKAREILLKLKNIPNLPLGKGLAGRFKAKKVKDFLGDAPANSLTVTAPFLPGSKVIIADPDKKTVTIAPLNPDVASKITIKPVDAGTVQQMAGLFERTRALFADIAGNVTSIIKQLQAENKTTVVEPTPPVKNPPTETKPSAPTQPTPQTPPAPTPVPTPTPTPRPVLDDKLCKETYGAEYSYYHGGGTPYCAR